jgi:hypothetical protein
MQPPDFRIEDAAAFFRPCMNDHYAEIPTRAQACCRHTRPIVQISDTRTRTIPPVAMFQTRERTKNTPAA